MAVGFKRAARRGYHNPVTYVPPQEVAAAGTTPSGLRDLLHVPGFLPSSDADALLDHCVGELEWRRDRVKMFGREMAAPRLCAVYGSPGLAYRYSGVTRRCREWPSPLRDTAGKVGMRLDTSFNFVLANCYRDGGDAIGWHADDERGLTPVIASLSLGAERRFRVRPRAGGRALGLPLAHGDLVLMWGRCQRDFRHAVPRTAAPVGVRVNLTLRHMHQAAESSR